MWPDCSPPIARPSPAHGLEHVAVPVGGDHDFPAGRPHGLPETQIAVDRGGDRPSGQGPGGQALEGADGHEVIPVDEPPLFVHGDHAVGVPVVGQSQVGAGGDHLLLAARPG